MPALHTESTPADPHWGTVRMRVQWHCKRTQNRRRCCESTASSRPPKSRCSFHRSRCSRLRQPGRRGEPTLNFRLPCPNRGGVLLLCCHHVSRSEERRVGKECRSRWSP